MCSVIGVSLDNPSDEDIELIKRVFIESRIRGMHATGIAYLDNSMLVCKIETVSADMFLNKHEIPKLSQLRLIGHCRYSTSDLAYNQPLYDENIAIVHNGVISQELPEKWESLYGIQTETKNDSELLLHTINSNPLELWANASIAAIELHRNGLMRYYRNGKRPLHKTELHNGYILTSTADIMTRASKNKYRSVEVDCGTEKDLQWTLG